MKRRAFFLGAGFSKALNPLYPTLSELTTSVGTSFLKRYFSGAIREHFNHLPNGITFDIEQLLSFLHSDWPWKSSVDRDLDKALYKVLVYEVAVALTDIPSSKISHEYRQFIQYLRATDTNTIISVNYDDLVEEYRAESMSTKDCKFFDGLLIRVEERFESNRKTSELHPLMIEETNDVKNPVRIVFAREWMEQASLVDFVATLKQSGYPEKMGGHWKGLAPEYVWRHFTSEELFHKRKIFGFSIPDVGDKVLHLHGALHWDGEPDGPTIRVKNAEGDESLIRLPAIVPPVMDKSPHYAAGRLKNVWNSAHAAIRSADEIIVIGFSFPPTDISCQFLFKSAVSKGTRIVVVNRDVEIISRYQTAFGNIPDVTLDFSFVKNGDPLLDYINAEILKSKAEPFL